MVQWGRMRAIGVLVLAGMIALAALVTACESGDALAGRRDPGTLVVAQPADVIALDPVRVTDSESIEVGELIFEGLVRWKAGTTDIEPGLAVLWDTSRDGLRWT